ncbi:30S ribosomal protein S4, partial [Staphylococcus pseudintermedius]
KQKLRYLYGMTERQFRNTFQTAGKQGGVHGENFMILLASRLDAIVYALGLARTRRQARQLVGHGHVEVDGKRVDIPSYTLKPGQVVTVREKSRKLAIIEESVEINNFVPDYLDFDADNLTGTFVRLPERSELPAEINEQLIVEYYSR